MTSVKNLQQAQLTPEDLEKFQKIKRILWKINMVFHNAEPNIGTLEKISDNYDFQWKRDENSAEPMTRQEYLESHPEIQDPFNFSFSLSAEDIIEQKIPMRVMGCTGVAKLFAKFAEEEGLDCCAVYAAKINDLEKQQEGSDDIVNGHQIIAVQFSDGVRMFDPGCINGLQFHKDNDGQEIVVPSMNMLLGEKLIPQDSNDPWEQRQAGTVITAIEPAQSLERVESYEDLKRRYLPRASVQQFRGMTNE